MKPFLFFLLGLFWLSGQAKIQAQNPIVIPENLSRSNLTPHVELAQKVDSTWTIEQIVRSEKAPDFVPIEKGSLRIGFVRGTFWLRFRLTNKSLQAHSLLFSMTNIDLHSIDFYAFSGSQPGIADLIDHFHIGERVPFSQRPIHHRNPVFPISLSEKQTQTIYLKITTFSPVQGSMYLWNPQQFWQQETSGFHFTGITIGILMAMLLYNLFLYMSLRDRGYLHYCLFLFFFLGYFFSFRGITIQYFWPDTSVALALNPLLLTGHVNEVSTPCDENVLVSLKADGVRLNLSDSIL